MTVTRTTTAEETDAPTGGETTDAPTGGETTDAPTDAETHWARDYDLLVRNAATSGSGTDAVVTLTITERVDADCGPAAFARTYDLEPEAAVGVADPLPAPDEGTYRLTARLSDGTAASREMYVHEAGILDYVGYAVTVHGGTVEIGKIQV